MTSKSWVHYVLDLEVHVVIAAFGRHKNCDVSAVNVNLFVQKQMEQGGTRNLIRDYPSAGGPRNTRVTVPSTELRSPSQLHPGEMRFWSSLNKYVLRRRRTLSLPRRRT